MATVTLTINGQRITALAGQTILEAATAANIKIPTLCHHPALKPIGACRVCLVEVKGQRTLQPACTFPVTDKLDVQTDSPKVVEARKFVLELLFSERNHFCMYCEMSGDCELQNLGYQYGLDHWMYPTYTKRFPVDATRDYFLMDHNRCVLCRRCMRACSDLVANHTLDMRQRGADSMISADLNIPFGDSSCISCGTCLQVCPTGSLIDKRSAFMARDKDTLHVPSTCSQCSIGCGIDVVTRDGNLLRVQGGWDAPVTAGVVCKLGRFDPLYNTRTRVTSPMVREGAALHKVSWSAAVHEAATRIRKAAPKKVGVLASTNATNEALYLVSALFHDALGTGALGVLNEVTPRIAEKAQGALSDIVKSDCILVVGADPLKDQPVASFFIKRTVDKGARLIVVDAEDNGLVPFAHMHFAMAKIAKAIEIAARADYPVVVYGARLTKNALEALKALETKAAFVAVEPGVNTRAARSYGLDNGFKPAGLEVLFILVGEQDWDGKDILKKVGANTFLIVQASYASPLTERADVILPMAIWAERSGSLTTTDGRVQKANKAIEPQGDAKSDWEILTLLAEKLDKKLGGSLEDLSARAAQRIQ